MTLAFKDTVLTNTGFNISNKAALGKTQFAIVKAVSTDYDLTNYKIEDLKNLTSLPNEIDSGSLTDYDAPENSISVIKLNFDNSKFKQGYTVRAIGLYGKDTDGNLFLHSLTVSDTPVVIPEVSGNVFDGLNHSITIFSGNNKKMDVNLEQQGAASVHYVNQAISNISGQIKDEIQPSLNRKAEQSDLDSLENKVNDRSDQQKKQLDADIEEKADKNALNNLNDNAIKYIRQINDKDDLFNFTNGSLGIYSMSDVNPKNAPYTPISGQFIVIPTQGGSKFNLFTQIIMDDVSGKTLINYIGGWPYSASGWKEISTKSETDKQFTQLNQNIEDAENRMNRNIDDRLQFFNSISDLNNANATEGTIAIVKGG